MDRTTELVITETATLPVRDEADIYTAVGLGRVMVTKIGFEYIDRIQLETIIIELTSNALRHGEECTITLEYVKRDGLPEAWAQPGLQVTVGSHSPDVIDLAKALAGECNTPTGIDKAILSVRQLADEFAIDSRPGYGTRVRVRKWAHAPGRYKATVTS